MTELADWSVGVGSVVGLTTTESLAPWWVGFDFGGVTTEIALTEIDGNATAPADVACLGVSMIAADRLRVAELAVCPFGRTWLELLEEF